MPGKRPTISDIARAAGVSIGAVSYALNNRPGVSDETRRRILDIAERLGWAPSSVARSLTGGQTNAVGLVVDRPARVLGIEPYFMQLISGIQEALSGSPTSLLLQVTDNTDAELATYRQWSAEHRVDGVLLVDLRIEDPRTELVQQLGLPAVVLGEPSDTDNVARVWTDDEVAIVEVVKYLAKLGHRRITRVAGPSEFLHTRTRSRAFCEAAERLGLDQAHIVTADYSDESGARMTRRALTSDEPPSALVFDNDVMAVAALGVTQELGLSVPEDVSLVAWDDSTLCELVRPALSAVRRPIAEHGATAIRMLTDIIAGETPHDAKTSDPELIPRASTGPAQRH